MSGILTRLFEQRATKGGNFHVSQEPPGWIVKNYGWLSDTGLSVTPELALNVAAVFACVRILAEGEAALPLVTYRRLAGGGKERAPEHPLYRLLHDLPNPEMTSIELRETMMGHLNTWGNAYADIELNRAGQVRALWPLPPNKVKPLRMNGELVYKVRLPKMDEQGNFERMLSKDRVLHIHGLGFDGIQGYSPVQLARQSIGLAIAAEQFGSTFYSNGARPGGVLKHPGRLGDEAYKRLKESWEKRHKGIDKANRVAILEEGLDYQEIGIPPEDAQFLQTRKFQIQEIARWFRVPPHMLADLDRATFSNIEHLGLEFVIYTLTPWLVRWEQAIYRDLLTEGERDSVFVEHLVDGLLRGDIKARYEAYSIGRQNGWLSADDIRRMENMNPLPGDQGDMYLVPLNMIPAEQAGMDFSGMESAPISEDRRQQRAQRSGGDAEAASYEKRAVRAALLRHRLQGAWFGTYQDVAERVLRREVQDVGDAARKHLKRGDYGSFSVWMEEFYREHIAFMVRNFDPLAQSYGELIAGAVADEIGQELWDTDEARAWVQSYLDAFAARHSQISEARLRKAAREALDSGESELEAVEGELDTWEEKRATETARWESVRFNNALAVGLYLIARRTKIIWRAMGDNCPYCSSLNGQVIGIREYFVDAGEFQPEGAERPLTISRSYHHPPIHDGCDCLVTSR